jgi:hypothetical protein
VRNTQCQWYLTWSASRRWNAQTLVTRCGRLMQPPRRRCTSSRWRVAHYSRSSFSTGNSKGLGTPCWNFVTFMLDYRVVSWVDRSPVSFDPRCWVAQRHPQERLVVFFRSTQSEARVCSCASPAGSRGLAGPRLPW